jgi:hypothetical protein
MFQIRGRRGELLVKKAAAPPEERYQPSKAESSQHQDNNSRFDHLHPLLASIDSRA